jgi:hypothetical protein
VASLERAALPASVPTLLGPVRVEAVDWLLKDKGALGMADFQSRILYIDSTASPQTQHHALWHEWMEFVLWDTGLHYILRKKVKEALCDAVATTMCHLDPAHILAHKAALLKGPQVGKSKARK